MKKFIKELIPYLIIVVVAVLIRTFLVDPVVVSGDSMNPTLKDGELLLLNKLNYRFNDIERFDIVVINTDNKKIIKRVIGLPGEIIEYDKNELFINGQRVEDDYNSKTKNFNLETLCKKNNIPLSECGRIPEDSYVVLGDNRGNSADSREYYGFIKREDILGSVEFSIWPIKKVK